MNSEVNHFTDKFFTELFTIFGASFGRNLPTDAFARVKQQVRYLLRVGDFGR